MGKIYRLLKGYCIKYLKRINILWRTRRTACAKIARTAAKTESARSRMNAALISAHALTARRTDAATNVPKTVSAKIARHAAKTAFAV